MRKFFAIFLLLHFFIFNLNLPVFCEENLFNLSADEDKTDTTLKSIFNIEISNTSLGTYSNNYTYAKAFTKKDTVKKIAKNIAMLPIYVLEGALFFVGALAEAAPTGNNSNSYVTQPNQTQIKEDVKYTPTIHAKLVAPKIAKPQKQQFISDMNTAMDKILNNKPNIGNTNVKTYLEYIKWQDSNFDKKYQNFLRNKNNMKQNSQYVSELSLQKGITSGIYNLYLQPFLEVSNKYNLNWSRVVEDCDINDDICTLEENLGIWSIETLKYIKTRYMFKYKIDKIQELDNLIYVTGKHYDNLTKWEQEIKDYSIKYELARKEKFYRNSVSKQGADLDEKLMFNLKLDTNTLYITKAKVFQIFNNGFLATSFGGNGSLIYIQSNLSNRLEFGDMFSPYLPVKYLGRNYTYKTLVGRKNVVPMFREVLPSEFKKYKSLKPDENFYFIDKPEWGSTLDTVGIYNPEYTYKYGNYLRTFRSGY